MLKFFLLLIVAALSTSAHFEVLYTPNVEVEKKEVKVTNFFGHPYDGKHLMKSGLDKDETIAPIKEVFLFHKGKKTDLTTKIKPIEFSTEETKGPGFDITLNKETGFRSAGDYALVMVPSPYWEPSENLYIQQITKLFINKGGFDTDWEKRCAEGHTEIIPLTRPYDVTVGSLFRGIVLDNEGKPVEGAVVEIEYLNYNVNMEKHFFGGNEKLPNEKKGVRTLISDKNGIFAFIPQKEGYWGAAALSAGSDKKYKGAELEQDPVIWIKVTK